MRAPYVWVGGLCVSLGTAVLVVSAADSPPPRGGGDEAAAMFRRLDSNSDGKLMMDDAKSNDRRLFERIFDMAGKPADGSVSREEFRRVFDQQRRGGGPPGRPNGDRPNGDRPTADRPNGDRPGADRPPPGPSGPRGQRPPQRRPEDRGPPGGGTSVASRDRSRAGSSDSDRGSRTEKSTDESSSSKGNGSSGSKALTGVWRGWIVDGRGDNPNSGMMQMELRIEGNRMSAREIAGGGGRGRPGGGGGRGGGDDGFGDGTFVVSAQGNSGNLDATGTSAGRHEGVEYLGIFEIKGDTLRWCVGNRGRARPQEYGTGRGNYLMVLQRQ